MPTPQTQTVFADLPVAMIVDGEAVIVGRAQVQVEVHEGIRYDYQRELAFVEIVDQVHTDA